MNPGDSTEDELPEAQRLDRELKRSLDDAPIGLCYVDSDLRFVHINEWLANINGLPAEAHLGKTIREVLPDVADGVEPQFLQVIDSGEPIIAGTVEAETPANPGVQHTFEHYYYPDVGVDGSVLGVSCVVLDITERKNAEETFRLAVEASPTAMVMVDQDSRIIMVNERTRALFGYSVGELMGRPVDLLIPDRARSVHAGHFTAYLSNPSPRRLGERGDLTGKRKDGSEFPVEIGLNPGEGIEGPFVLACIVDISLRKKAEQERRLWEAKLQEAQRLESLSVLAGGIAHDFNNLLVGVLGYSELALQDLPAMSPVSRYVERIAESARRAAELCGQMLAFSGKGNFVVAPRDVSEIVQVLGHLLEVSISKSVVLRYELAGNLPAVDVDLGQIHQVVMNLITNGAEAIGERSGVVTIVTGMMDVDEEYASTMRIGEELVEGPYVYLEVSDTGCGMDEETILKMFDAFFTTKFTGRGLGLAAVLGIVRGHKGAIRVNSELGKGTRVKVLLPSSQLSVERLEATRGGAPEGWRSTATVLIIDDEEAVRGVLRQMCENVGCTVLTAKDGGEGVDVFRQHAEQVALILLDMTMPHMAGPETFRMIRSMEPDAQVILMSGHDEVEATSLFVGKGLAGFLQKPISMRALYEKMQELMEGRSVTTP